MQDFKLYADHAQRRVARLRDYTYAEASVRGIGGDRIPNWDAAQSSANCWWDPVTKTGMLRPAPATDTWHSSASGIYARLTNTDFTLSESTKWKVFTDKVGGLSGDFWLQGSNLAANSSGITTTTWAKNQGFFVGAYRYNVGNDVFAMLDCGWNSSASKAAGVALRVWSDGVVDVYKGGVVVGSYSVQLRSGEDPTGFMLIPFRRKELLVVTDLGGGFVHVFDDISDTDTDPTITPANKFWFACPAGGTAKLQLAPLRYQSSGHLVFNLCSLPFAPELGATVETSAWYEPGYHGSGGGSFTTSAREAANPAAVFTPDGVKRTCFLRVDLTAGASNYSSHFIFAGSVGVAKQVLLTDANEIEFSDHCSALSLEVPEGDDGVRLAMVVEQPAGTNVPNLTRGSNRPVVLRLGEIDIVDGRTETWDYPETLDPSVHYAMTNIRDWWKALDAYIFNEIVPVAGDAPEDVVGFVLGEIGFDPDMIDIDASGVAIQIAHGESDEGVWPEKIRAGDRASEIVKRMFHDYMGNWFYDFVPTLDGIKFIGRDPATEDLTPVLTVYLTMDEAIAALVADGYSESEARELAPLRVIREATWQSLAPEANEIHVTGWDPRRKKPIRAVYRDTVAQDPTVPIADRPENWAGEPWLYGLFHSGLTTQGSIERCCELLARRLTRVRPLGQLMATQMWLKDDYQLPVWKGNVIRVHDRGDYRVRSFRTDCLLEPETGRIAHNRESLYVVEKVGDGVDSSGSPGTPGLNLAEIMRFSRGFLRNATVIRRGAEYLPHVSPYQVFEVTL